MSRPDGWDGYCYDVMQGGHARGVALGQLSNGAVLSQTGSNSTRREFLEINKYFDDVNYFWERVVVFEEQEYVYLRGMSDSFVARDGRKGLVVARSDKVVVCATCEGDRPMEVLELTRVDVDAVVQDFLDRGY